MRRILIVSMLVLSLAACNDDSEDAAEPPLSTTTSVGDAQGAPTSAGIGAVRDAVTDPIGTENFPSDPIGGDGRIVCVDGEDVRVYVFASEGERAAAVAAIDPADPSHVGNAIVSWVGTPRLWAEGPAIVMYSGSDEALVADLSAEFGDPFAVGQGRGDLPGLGC